MATKYKNKKQVSSAYVLPNKALSDLTKIMKYNDSCEEPVARVTRLEAIELLQQYGWSGSVHSLNRLLKAHFGRSFTGASHG